MRGRRAVIAFVSLAAVAAGCGGRAAPGTTPPTVPAVSQGGFFAHRVTRSETSLTQPEQRGVEVWASGGGLRIVRSDGSFAALPAPGDVSRRPDSLSRDPQALAAEVRSWAATPTDEENGHVPTGAALDQRTFRMLGALEIDQPVPPDLAHAIGEALKASAGVTAEQTTDPAGRPALRLRRVMDAITAPDVPLNGDVGAGNVHVRNGIQRDLYLDPTTLDLLAYSDTILTGEDVNHYLVAGSVQRALVFGPTEMVATLPAGAPRAIVDVTAVFDTSRTDNPVTCPTSGLERACAVLLGDPEALTRNEACASTAGWRFDTRIDGVVDGRAVHVRWCGARGRDLIVAFAPDTTFSATLTPISARTVAQCAAIVNRTASDAFGDPSSTCIASATANWYHATITTTHGAGGIITCHTVAYDPSGGALFGGHLIFRFAGMFGNVASEPGKPATFDWYVQLNQVIPPVAAVDHYQTDCLVNPMPPV